MLLISLFLFTMPLLWHREKENVCRLSLLLSQSTWGDSLLTWSSEKDLFEWEVAAKTLLVAL